MLTDPVTTSLCTVLTTYCEAQGLPHLSADELQTSGRLTPRQREWLDAFVALWDTTTA